MIRHLHPTDSPALFPFRQRSGQDEVRSLAAAIKGGNKNFPLVKYTSIALSPRAWQNCWVRTKRAKVEAVLRAGPRSGPFAWELSELYLAKSSRDVATEIFEQIAFPAGTSGARRIFLRMPVGNDLFNAARSAGFQPVYSETIYSVESARDALSRTGDRSEGLQLKLLDAADQHALFRLFCGVVPINVRSKTGQTLDEWSSSLETPGRKSRDWGVVDTASGRLVAHVQSGDIAGGRYFAVQAGSDAGCSTLGLISAGLERAGNKRAFTMVPSYDEKLGETLTEIGFTPGETYDVMVKTLAVSATQTVPGWAVIER